MTPDDIRLSDWKRILLGEVPPEFYLELVIRTFFIYLLIMVSMRMLGKRMSTQISRLDLCALVALASAVGVPILVADRGLVPPFIIAAVVVGINRFVAARSFRDQKFENLTQGDIDVLVEDSVMRMDRMKKSSISRDRLLAQLRSENLHHLGMVKRVYLEASGTFTLIKQANPRPGLPVIPAWDSEFINKKIRTTDTIVCSNCGATKPTNGSAHGDTRCTSCGESNWTKAYVEI
ncbi:YetF domain-containing protein [Telluribacter sp. SYSU D00476]|uniref:YetF domain-containing protein n=1 Tax=Telluribacter sp. SYSU D00476 TaxID=2811430 RepID=UPI001FF695E7|nr:YetF domain-containing protein [Telluribacter sp. SYSU D00476]